MELHLTRCMQLASIDAGKKLQAQCSEQFATLVCRPQGLIHTPEELSFDSSLMDLVAEVEQMVSCTMNAAIQPSAQSSKSFVASPALTHSCVASRPQVAVRQAVWLASSSDTQVCPFVLLPITQQRLQD